MQRISPFLWFNDQAEEAAKFYTSVFENSKIKDIAKYGEAGPGTKGQVMTVSFEIDGHEFIALNGGPQFKFTEAISFVINCDSQDEIDYYWSKFTKDGMEQPCGWVKDKFGLSWQVVPTMMAELMSSKDEAASQRMMKAMLQMSKLDIQKLRDAYDGKA